MEILCLLVRAYIFCMFARIILSWFPIRPGTAFASIAGVLYSITEPLLGPVRRVLPPVGVGGMGFDLSPLIVLLFLQIVVAGLILRC